MVSVLILSGLAVLGCKDKEQPEPRFALMETSAVGVEVGSAAGVGEVRIPIRVVNEYGAAVPTSETVTVRATSAVDDVTETLTPDGLGVASLSLSGAPQAILVEVIDGVGELGEDATSWILGGEPDAHGLDWLPVMPTGLDVDQTYAAEGGVALIADQEVWWQPATPGVPAQHMLTMSEANRGAWEVDIDADGLPDLALWNEQEIILLRGHARAGYVWGWGVAMEPDVTLQWLGIGDADSDGIRDVVMLLNDDGTQVVQVLGGDGVWGFDDELEALEPDIGLRSVAAGWHSSGGGASILVLADDYRLRQYNLDGGEWALKGSDLTPSLPDDAYLAVSRDITGDGVDEALILQPPVSSGNRGLTILNYGNGPTVYSVAYDTFREGFSDVNGDGVQDIVLSEGGADPRLGVITVKSDGNNFTFTSLLSVDAPGPMAAGDFNDDGVVDLALHDGELRLYPGRFDEEDQWDVASPKNQSWEVDPLGPLWSGDLDGDGRAEVVVVRLREGRATLSVFTFEDDPEDGSLQLGTAARADVDDLDESGTASASDVAACGDTAYAVINDGGDDYLVSVPSSGGGTTALSVAVSGDRVTCGDFGGDIVVAVGGASGVTFYDAELNEIQSQGGVGDLDADGLQGLGTCDGDCTVEAGDLDGDGDPEVLTGGESPTLAGWSDLWDLSGSGEASFFDMDGDGWPDSALSDGASQRITVYPTLSGAPGPATYWTWNKDFVGRVMMADVDGDGRPEALVATDEGQLIHTQPGR